MKLTWNRAPKYLQEFNGIQQSTIRGGLESGIFKEKHSHEGKWSIRNRPVNDKGEATNSWGQNIPFDTKKAAIAFAEGREA